MTLRLAHLSDLHLARRPSGSEWNLKRVLGYANHRLGRSFSHSEELTRAAIVALARFRPDVVLLTGDLAQHGVESEYAAAGDCLAPLTAAGVPVLAVSGNHDYYGGAIQAGYTALADRLALGNRPDALGVFRFGGVEVIRFDQAGPTAPFCSDGRVDAASLDALAKEFVAPPSGVVVRVAFGHYPLCRADGRAMGFPRGLSGAGRLAAFLDRAGVSAYFCGHNHRRFSAPISPGCRQYAAAALPRDGKSDIYECGGGGVAFLQSV